MSVQLARAEVTISNELGLHARPAMTFVELANEYKSDVRIQKDDQTVDGKSIMQVMMLAATQGTRLKITAEGEDAEEAISALQQLIESNFEA